MWLQNSISDAPLAVQQPGMAEFVIRIRKQAGNFPSWRPQDYDVLVNGERAGEIYYNMTGYCGTLPLPGGGQFDPGESGISAFRREAARINREARAAQNGEAA